MKKSIKKLVAGSLVCAVAAGSAPLFQVSPAAMTTVQAATQDAEDNQLFLQEEAYGSTRWINSSLWIYKDLGTTLKISSTSEEIKNVTCTFESSDPSVFTIDQNGEITPQSVGTATLTIHAKSEDGKEQTVEQEVDVVEHFVCGDMAYGMISDDEFVFLAASYETKNINRIMLPYMINEDVIKVIGKESCAGYKNVKLIEVPDSVVRIEERAFADDPSLEFVMIPAGVTHIADDAFGEGRADAKKIIIKGYEGSAAEEYAEAHKDIVTFEAIEGDYEPYKYVYSMELQNGENIIEIEKGMSDFITVNTYPEVVDEEITFTSADDSIVSVTTDGAIQAHEMGTTTITATTTTGLTETIVVSVTRPPYADYMAHFKNGTDSWTYGFYPVGVGSSIIMPEVEEREGYRFLGWSNGIGLYQPGESVGIHDGSDASFVAQWEKIEEVVVTPTGSAITTTAPAVSTKPAAAAPSTEKDTTSQTAPVDKEAATLEPASTKTPVSTQASDTTIAATTPVATLKPASTRTPATNAPTVSTNGAVTTTTKETANDNTNQNLKEALTKLVNKATLSTTKKTGAKKNTFKILTKAKKKFVAGKKYTIKAKKLNTKKALKWSVSDKDIATINEKTGVLKAKKAGTVTITGTCGNVTKKITIKIK